MTSKIDGNAKSLIETNRKNLEKWLDSLTTDEVKGYLRLDRTAIKKMHPQDCGEIAYILGKASLSIQVVYGKKMGQADWIHSNVKMVCAQEIYRYNTYKTYEERIMLLVSENDYAKALYEEYLLLKQQAEQIKFLSSKIDFMCRLLTDNQKWKGRQD